MVQTLDDAHPLFDSLLLACKTGDLDQVKHLVEIEEVPLNCRDQWDCSPLYYTALCGHLEVAKYLLDQGANCNPNTFEAERCYYGALNETIRTTLKTYRFTKAVDANADYAIFLYKSLLMDSLNYYSDICLSLPNAPESKKPPFKNMEFHVHLSVLVSRCPFLAIEIMNRWPDKSTIAIKSKKVTSGAIRALLHWIYSGELQRDMDAESLDSLTLLARNWKLPILLQQVRRLKENRTMGLLKWNYIEQRDTKGVQDSLQMLVWCLTDAAVSNQSKLRGQVPGLTVSEYLDGLEMIKTRMLRGTGLNQPTSEDISEHEIRSAVQLVNASKPDIVVIVNERRFPCHKSFLIRSEYFQALLLGGFLEANNDGNPKLMEQRVSFTKSEIVFECVLDFMYTDRCLRFPNDSVAMLELLRVADLLLLDRLKTLCINHLVSLPSDVISNHAALLRSSWAMNLPRLEQFVTILYAQSFDMFVDTQEFKDLILESAESVVNREDIDTVVFVDDLKYWLSRMHGFDGEEDIGISGKNGLYVVRVGQDIDARRQDLDRKIEKIHSVLEELDLTVLA